MPKVLRMAMGLLLIALVVSSTAAIPQALAVPLTAPLAAPRNVSLVRDGKVNTLTWEGVESAVGYKIYASASPTGKFKLLTSTKQLTYPHKNAPATRFYKVHAYAGKAVGVPSDVVGSVASATNINCAVNGNVITFSWAVSQYATSYKLNAADGKDGPWATVSDSIRGNSALVTITSGVPRYFQLLSLFGDTVTGASPAIGVFEPISGVKVVCQETRYGGPTDLLNVVWKADPAATKYEVLRATLPSKDFVLLGETTKSYYPDTRHPTRAYAYKVRPVYGKITGAESAPVTLWSDMPGNELPPEDISSGSGVVLLVNKGAQVVTAYVQDENGRYTVPLRHMICSTGKLSYRTPNGEHTLERRMGEWYRYPSGVYIRYPFVFSKDLYFHSVLYSSSKAVSTSTVNRLGTRQSLGCVRLKVSEAKWLYEELPVGTTVYIVEGAKIPALTKALKPKVVNANNS